MLHLLIVDDEPMAVDFLVEVLQEVPDLELEITKAYSGKDALAKLGAAKADILLTDIRMHGMDGIELADQILLMWPRCKVIFLTGFNDFEYAQTAIRKGGIDYVLKTEGDTVIINALRKAIAGIEAEVNEDQILQKARQQYHLALPSLRRDYLLECLQGEEDSLLTRKRRFQELGIDLNPDLPVLLGLGRIDNWGKFAAPADRVLLFYSIFNISEEFFGQEMCMLVFQYDRTRVAWLVQPKEGQNQKAAAHAMADCAERIQSTCKTMLKTPLSIALSDDPVTWEHAGSRIEALKLMLTFQVGSGVEMLVSIPQEGARAELKSRQLLNEAGRLRSTVHKLDLLEAYMDNGDKAGFISLYNRFFQAEGPLFAGEAGKWFGLELFSHLSAFFLTYMNKRELIDEIEGEFQTEKLYNPDLHAGWLEMVGYFGSLGARIADRNGRMQRERAHDLIGKVHRYIDLYLHEELSLTKFAELVYLSPPYFSRIYKQITGQGLLEYINETRIRKAKLLLKTTDKKIHEIAAEVGLESAPYFTRLFRKKTGRTPQEYRESSKGMEAL